MRDLNSYFGPGDDEDDDDDYQPDLGIGIHSEVFDQDFDEVDFEGLEEDDSDAIEAERYGLD